MDRAHAGEPYNALLSQLVEEAALEAAQSQFESERGHQNSYPVSSKVEHTTDNRKTEERYLYWVPLDSP